MIIYDSEFPQLFDEDTLKAVNSPDKPGKTLYFRCK